MKTVIPTNKDIGVVRVSETNIKKIYAFKTPSDRVYKLQRIRELYVFVCINDSTDFQFKTNDYTDAVELCAKTEDLKEFKNFEEYFEWLYSIYG